jgi:hypothetical protein
MEFEEKTSITQPWDAGINIGMFEFGINVCQDRLHSSLMLKAIDIDLDNISA